MNKQIQKLEAEVRVLNLIAEDMTRQTGICLMSYDEKILKAMIEEKRDRILSMREVKDVEIAKLTTLLEQEKSISESLDRCLSKTTFRLSLLEDAHEVTERRLALYENEAK